MPATKKPTKTTRPSTTTKKPRTPQQTPAPEVIDAGGGILVEVVSPPAKPAKAKPATTMPEAKPKKLSALDAAAKVLADSREPMNTKQMIEAMAAKGLWTSPGGKTPHATLYSAILREIDTKKGESRFRKTTKGHFAATTA